MRNRKAPVALFFFCCECKDFRTCKVERTMEKRVDKSWIMETRFAEEFEN